MNKQYWGKSLNNGEWHHLGHHCLDVAAVAEGLLDANPVLLSRMQAGSPMPMAETRQLVLFLAACHDLGKFHPGFQRILPLGEQLGHSRGEYAHHHTQYGLAIWEEMSPCESIDIPDRYSMSPLVVAAMCHHGRPLEPCDLGPSYFAVSEDATEFVRQLAAFFLTESYQEHREVECESLSWFVAGLVILADWIGSNERWFGPVPSWHGIDAYWTMAKKRAARAISEAGLTEARASKESGFAELLPHLQGHSPSLMQQCVLDLPVPNGPELLIIEDLTGGGKTEAALLAAHRCMKAGTAGGLYVGLPTMATANAMYDRLSEAHATLFDGSSTSLTLAHGSTFLNENYMQSIVREVEADKDGGRSACSSWLADNRKKALLAPCGAGTMDQAILGILGAKHQSLRLLGLCRSVLVADEVHSYDTYTGTLLANLLTFHAAMGGSAVLLSATMTGWLRRKLVRAWHTGRALAGASPVEAQGEARDDEETFPLMTRVCDSGCERRPVETTRRLDVAVRPVHDPAAMPDALEEAASAGACACWIRNTVSDVLEAARVLVEERGIAEEDVLIFHSRFTGADRAAIEGEVLRRFGKRSRAGDRSGKILIASQVVEQSLDLDFDLLLSDLAPMELMIQRAGRCHRHERSRPAGYEEPAMHVLMPRPEDEVSEEWFADLFEKGQYVYPHVSILWRTARLLQEKQAIVLPRDARTLVEGACGEDAPEAPEALGRREDKAVAEAMAAEAVARFGMLDFAKGYAFEDTPWGTDVTAPTRLGEDSVNVRLLRVAARSLDSATVPESCERSVSELLESMPDKGKWSLCLPLQEASHGVWVGNGKDGRGRTVSVRYDRRTGLVVES